MTRSRHAARTLGSTLGIDVPLRVWPGRSGDLDTFGLEDLFKCCSEAVVTVVEKEADQLRLVFSSHGEVAIWVHRARFAGPSVIQPVRKRRVCISMKKTTCRVFRRIDSTVKRSQPIIEEAGVRMHCRQISRSGAGRNWTAAMRRMPAVEISMPIFVSSLWIRL
jgi:hypothetical protein